ncbi:unnamed protein product [Clonostachys solani]|uniref:Oxidoreductase n=1 Tax=Clonostachys solani TaxID=160281 RepID=A0A9N9ZJX2_9HYPO|nr:unnamed protein product [Clonostachys solani]
MVRFAGFTDFNPEEEIPSLEGKVVFVTGGTAGLGKQSIQALAKHDPQHIYFTGRSRKSADSVISEIKSATPNASITFLEMDFTSLASVKAGVSKFNHDRLDILICNAGVMAVPAALSKDGFEVHFAINHLAHAMIIRELLPVLVRTTEIPGSDVRVVILTSEGWKGHPSGGVRYDKVRTNTGGLVSWLFRYGQSKFANVVYAAEIARRYPKITSVSVHPGVVKTDLVNNLGWGNKALVHVSNYLMGVTLVEPEQGRLSQLWVAAGAEKSHLVNGGLYYPVGVLKDDEKDKEALSEDGAKKLWEWTGEVLDSVKA